MQYYYCQLNARRAETTYAMEILPDETNVRHMPFFFIGQGNMMLLIFLLFISLCPLLWHQMKEDFQS